MAELLLIHSNTTNGDTNFVDSSGNATITPVGQAQHWTAQAKFGASSIHFDGDFDYLDCGDWPELGSGDFTIDCWVYLSDWASANGGNYTSSIVAKDSSSGRAFVFSLTGTATSFTSLGFIGFSDNTTYQIVSEAYSFNLNTWYHFAVTRSGNLLYLFVNGVLLNIGGTSFSTTIQNVATTLKVGASVFDATYRYYLNGYVDELRITNTAEWTADFTPPTAPYGVSAALLASWVEPYPFGSIELLDIWQEPYLVLSAEHLSIWYEPQSYGCLLTIIEPFYLGYPEQLAWLKEPYTKTGERLRSWFEPYGQMLERLANWQEPYLQSAEHLATITEPYPLLGSALLAVTLEPYQLDQYDRHLGWWREPYHTLIGDALIQEPTATVTVGGREIDPLYLRYRKSEDEYAIDFEVRLAEDQWLQCARGEVVVLTVAGAEIHGVVEQLSETDGGSGPAFALSGRSQSVSLAGDVLTGSYSGLADQIAASLAAAHGLTVDWQHLSGWPIAGGLLTASGESSLSVLGKLVGAVDGVIQTMPDNTVVVRRRYPDQVTSWDTATAELMISDQDFDINFASSFSARGEYDAVLVTSGTSSATGVTITEGEQLSASKRVLQVSVVPWADRSGLLFTHTGGAWATIEQVGEVSEAVVDEEVQFIGGAANLAKPVYGLSQVTWQQTDLGAVSFEESGALTAAVAAESLALVTYTTRYLKYILTSPRRERVQVVVDEVDA